MFKADIVNRSFTPDQIERTMREGWFSHVGFNCLDAICQFRLGCNSRQFIKERLVNFNRCQIAVEASSQWNR